jgi:phospholipid/cholesterol/gamma-HCH transport system permease protein
MSAPEKGAFLEAAEDAGQTLEMLFAAVGWIRSAPRKLREIRDITTETIFSSMPVIFIIGLFSGFILALQAGRELMRIGAEGQVGVVVGASMCRAMGPVMAALAFAGLIGSSFAAQIGTMKVKEEIDALEVMSIDPVYYLVMPRLLAVAMALPIMTIYTNVIGILGGALVAQLQLGVDGSIYFTMAFDEGIKLRDIYGGLLKSVVFGITIALVACSRGMKAGHGPEGVGRATLWTVVVSFTLIVVFDYFMDWALYPR